MSTKMRMSNAPSQEQVEKYLNLYARLDIIRGEIAEDMCFSETLAAIEKTLECLNAEIKVVLLQALRAGELKFVPKKEKTK